MKITAAERLSEALAKLLMRIHEHCQKVIDSPLKMGLCNVNPKYSRVPVPTASIQSELENRARQYFEPLGVVGFYFQYWTPPILPVVEKPLSNSVDDYLALFQVPQFDDAWQQTSLARCLIFCPTESELSCIEEWFVPQIEAIRFTPILHQEIKELQQMENIRIRLSQHPLAFFDTFIARYVMVDHNLSILKKEREEYAQKKKNWRSLYSNAISIFEKEDATLQSAYVESRKNAAQTRDPKIKELLWAFAANVEKELIASSPLCDEIKQTLIKQLQEVNPGINARKYKATRPVISMSDIECGQFIYLLMVEFAKALKKKKILGEIILFIWLCQSVAFSDQEFPIDEILRVSVKDIDLEGLVIKLDDKEIYINGGYAEMLSVWIGPCDRENRRKLFPSLTYDNLEKQISKISKGFWGIAGKLSTRDFLAKVHVVPYTRITIDLRKRIDEQAKLLKSSPYKIHSGNIKKQILKAFSQ